MEKKPAIVPQLRCRSAPNQASPSIFMRENGCILSSLWHRPCDGEDGAIATFKSHSREDQHDQNSGFIDGCSRVVRLYQCLGLTRIIHEGFYYNRRYAATTSLAAGRLAARSVNILFQVCLSPSRLRAPVLHGVSAVSSRTLVDNAG